MNWGVALSPEISLFGPLLFSGNLDIGLEKAKKVGLDGVELSLRDSAILNKEHIRSKLKVLGLRVFAIATGQTYVTDGYSVFGETSKSREKTVQRLKGHIDFAAELGAFVIIGGIVGKLTLSGKERDLQREAGIECIRNVADYAQTKGVVLVLEAINRYETNIVNSGKDGKEYLDEIQRDNMKLLLDTFHMNIEETSIEKTLVEYKDFLGYVHFADSNRYAPGMGHIHFQEIMRTLEAIHYNGPITAEILPVPNDEKALEQAASCFSFLDGISLL